MKASEDCEMNQEYEVEHVTEEFTYSQIKSWEWEGRETLRLQQMIQKEKRHMATLWI